jgi:hypothetical protein
MTHLERFDDIKTRHPQGEHLHQLFVGWMTGTAARAERDPTYRPSVLAEVERFLAHHEAEIIVSKPESDSPSLPVS